MLYFADRHPEPDPGHQSAETSTGLAERYQESPQLATEESMFSLHVRHDSFGRIIVIGRPTRKRAEAFLNIPISDETRRRLNEQVVGSLAMGTSALLEWALQELKRREISIEAHPQE